MYDYIGILGLLFILAGWVIELFDVVKKKQAQVPLEFAVLYAAGSFLLMLHSMQLSDTVFIILNAFATLIAVVNIAFNLWQKTKAGKKKAGRGKKKRR
ncbi:Uncharacterised protein [uncultured archaeon]|nr:Uncharacterised protein [uncultured archaeon]